MQTANRKAAITLPAEHRPIPVAPQPAASAAFAVSATPEIGVVGRTRTTTSRVRAKPGAASVHQSKPDPGILADVLTDVAAMFAALDSDVLEAA